MSGDYAVDFIKCRELYIKDDCTIPVFRFPGNIVNLTYIYLYLHNAVVDLLQSERWPLFRTHDLEYGAQWKRLIWDEHNKSTKNGELIST